MGHKIQERKAQVKLVFLVLFLLVLNGCHNKPLYKDTQIMMGTFVEVVSPEKDASRVVFAEIKRVEDLLSKYKPNSEVSILNRASELKVSPETFYILKKSKEFYILSNGAFDITTAPLSDLWGFTHKKYILPKRFRITDTLKLVGSDKIELNDSVNVVKFKLSGMKIDLGGIAKGYALDCAVNKLKEAGINSCLINIGGQVYCLGKRFGKPWRIVVRDDKNSKSSEILEIEDKSVATSGDYEQFFEVGKKRYSHIFNPKSGYPADLGVISATIIAPSGLTADALSTAVFVLGKDKGQLLVKKFPGVSARITEKNINKRE
ncbi:MAG: FAD:protein FMN transferase [Candidatus Omnitrophica bacterium]|nr:FAD:protein FMN transferase [Candidatus Omnitrophota bacterium]